MATRRWPHRCTMPVFLLAVACGGLIGSFAGVAQAEPRAATPSDYGFAAPAPLPELPGEIDVFTPPLLGDASGPSIAEYTRSGGPDDTITFAGPDFIAAARFRFYGQTAPGDAVTFERDAHVHDALAACVILPEKLPAWSTYLIWPESGGTFGKPVAVNRTDAWWIGPDKVLAGESVSVYGRNLSHGNGIATSWIYVKASGKAGGRWIKPNSVNPYRVSFDLPAMAAGDYEVWAHNGHGGAFGWSGPLKLSVLARSPWAGQEAKRVDVKQFGAIGDGVSDDTSAIQKALDAAGKAAPATLYFPAGTYSVDGQLDLRNNVSWAGDDRDKSIIKVGPKFASTVQPFWQALIYSDSEAINNVTFDKLTLDGAGNLGKKSLIIYRHHNGLKITHCRFNWRGAPNGCNVGTNPYTVITDNEFIGDQVFLANSNQVVVARNKFWLTDYANGAIISWGGRELSVTDNAAQDFDPKAGSLGGVGAGRFFISQCHPDSNRNFYIADNTTTNMAPPVDIGDPNQGEQIMFEVGTSTLVESPLTSTATTTTFVTAPPAVLEQDAVIVRGRGVGQSRRVASVSGTTISVSPPWAVVPDKSSVIGIGPVQTHSVIYHNRLDGKKDYPRYQTASVGMTMYGNVSDIVFAGNHLTHLRSGMVDEFSQVPNPATPMPSALFFNLMTDNSVDGAYLGLRIVTCFLTEKSSIGTIGHLGNTYRRNTCKNIVQQGFHFGADQGGFLGGDLDQDVFEHNSMENVPTGVWVGKATAWINNPVGTKFQNVVFYKNVFDRGTAPAADAAAIKITGGQSTMWRSGNVWQGFGQADPDPSSPPPTETAH